MERRLRNATVWVPLLMAAIFVAGIFVGRHVAPGGGTAGSGEGKLSAILSHISAEYVDQIDTDSLLETIYPNLLSALDPHSVYIPAEDLATVNDELEGSFSGIGISFNTINDTINVIEVIAGGPSEKIGLMPGDRIVEIDDTIVAGKGWSNEKVISTLRGPEGSKVKLGVKRHTSSKLLTFEITRGEIPVNSVVASYIIEPGVGYLRVDRFGRNTFDEFYTAAHGLRADGAEKLIVDLRGNGGGYMEMAILMANEFLKRGQPIVSTHGRDVSQDNEAVADGTGGLQEMELTVLMDEYSASASEIFAGAIQDNDRGLIVGRRSFGKGLVQRQIDLDDGSAIRLTTARYYTPSGRSIQKRYEPGGTKAYQADLIERYDRGELFNADSVKLDKSITFHTAGGRAVYGGGGIMPDIFVPNDTTGVTSYYLNVFNAGLLQKFAFDYNDNHRTMLSKVRDTATLLKVIPPDDALLEEFAAYAEKNGVAQRWHYINISRDLIVNQLKALIARGALGTHAFYEVDNLTDPSTRRALKAMADGETAFPVKTP